MNVGTIVRLRKWRTYFAPGSYVEYGYNGKDKKTKDEVALFTFLGTEDLKEGTPALDPAFSMYVMGYSMTLHWRAIKEVLDKSMPDVSDERRVIAAKHIAVLQWKNLTDAFEKNGHDPLY